MGTLDEQVRVQFDDSFARAVPELMVQWRGADVADPRIAVFNHGLAGQLGLDDLAERPDLLSGAVAPAGARPAAMVYAGHQFGQYNPRLGDGRALLLGEVVTPDGRTVDLHLKGSGRTPFARGGDGKATLGPMLREYVVSEAMHALGVPTTRSLAVVTTGEYVHREHDRTGAVLTRVAASHLRVGTFEYAARLEDRSVLRRLADHAIARHHPAAAESERPYLALLDGVIDAQAALVARWMLVGFVHGVMNTDNTTISGETIDYGPCAFVDQFDPDAVFSSIDHGGRYRYGNQPVIAQWNLARLAESLLPLMEDDMDASLEGARELIDDVPTRYARHWRAGMRAKLGLDRPDDGDTMLFDGLLTAMATARLDYTATFRRLAASLRDDATVLDAALADWLPRWRDRLGGRRTDPSVADAMDAVNPVYIPRNHLVEAALDAAVAGDLTAFTELVDVVTRPFAERPGRDPYAHPAPPEFTATYQTFCGT